MGGSFTRWSSLIICFKGDEVWREWLPAIQIRGDVWGLKAESALLFLLCAKNRFSHLCLVLSFCLKGMWSNPKQLQKWKLSLRFCYRLESRQICAGLSGPDDFVMIWREADDHHGGTRGLVSTWLHTRIITVGDREDLKLSSNNKLLLTLALTFATPAFPFYLAADASREQQQVETSHFHDLSQFLWGGL